MKTSILSRKYGWYLARVNASFENFANIVLTSYKTIQKFNFKPGYNIKICNLDKSHSNFEYMDKFIILPYFKDFIINSWQLYDILRYFANLTYHKIDKKYINNIIKLLNTFHQNRDNKLGFIMKEFFEFDCQEKKYIDIAMSESWLNENSVNLGESVLLRNDEPSPIIL